jgi:hypothetical protein
MWRSRRNVYGERKTRAVCHCHELRPLAPLGFSDTGAPFFATTKVASMKHSSKLNLPRSSRSLASASSIPRNLPERTHSWSRRWQVWYGGNFSGISFHRAPVRRTHKIPLTISRFDRRGRPLPSARTFCLGMRDSIYVHCISVNSSRGVIVCKRYMTLWQSTSHFFIFETASNIYRKYLEEFARYQDMSRLSLELKLYLSNDGTRPAEDIDVLLHFPDGFQLYDKKSMPNQPKEPKPPERLKYGMQYLLDGPHISSMLSPSLYSRFRPSPEPPRNVSPVRIKRSKSYDVDFHVTRLKHNLREPIDTIIVVFNSFDSAKSFNIQCRILAGNLPHAVEQELHIIVNKDLV